MQTPTVVGTTIVRVSYRREGNHADPVSGRSRVGVAAVYHGARPGDYGRGGRRFRRTGRTGAQHGGNHDGTPAQKGVSDTQPPERSVSLYDDGRSPGADD